MPSIKKIRERLDQLLSFKEDYSSQLKLDPQNISHKLTITGLDEQINELQQQLYKENIKRDKEVVELRLLGAIAQFGSFPLKLVGGITTSFSNALFQTSRFLQFGKKGGKSIENIINTTIDLRLEGLEKGSTIFYISAKTSPNLFGTSVIQNSLENTFELLNSNSPNKIIDNISIVGSQSIKYYSAFFRELTNDDLELEMTWRSPNNITKEWKGTKDKILSLYNTLNNISFSEPEEIIFEGEIITLSIKGKFEILTKDKGRYYGSFPTEMTEIIKQLHVGDLCKGTILKTTVESPISEKVKYEYLLTKIYAT